MLTLFFDVQGAVCQAYRLSSCDNRCTVLLQNFQNPEETREQEA